MRIVEEAEFRQRIGAALTSASNDIGAVTGPGRSGAVAAVYASHILQVPFIPYGQEPDIAHLGRLLIIDTAEASGGTIRKAARKYRAYDPETITVFKEPPRVAFWYEEPKPQRYRHERRAA